MTTTIIWIDVFDTSVASKLNAVDDFYCRKFAPTHGFLIDSYGCSYQTVSVLEENSFTKVSLNWT